MAASAVRRLTKALPWPLVLVGIVAAEGAYSGDGVGTVLYLVWFVVGVLLPGTVLGRLLLRPRTLLDDLGVGAVVGWAGLLVCWLLGALTHLPWLVWSFPVVVIGLTVAVPRLRPVWRGLRRDAAGGALPHWLLAGLVAVAFLLRAVAFRSYPTVAGATNVYQDIWWHLSLNHEMTRGLPFQMPEVAGEPLKYHWFSNALMAAGHQAVGTDLYLVTVRLWPAVALVTLVLATFSLARRLRLGVVASLVASLAAAVLPATLTDGGDSLISDAWMIGSPSNTLGAIALVGVAIVVTAGMHTRLRIPTVLALALTVLLGAGAKPTVLSLAAAGAMAALVAVPFVRVPRQRRVMALWLGLVLVCCLVGFGLSNLAVSATGGTGIKLFGAFYWSPVRAQLMPGNIPGVGGPLPPGFQLAAGPLAVGLAWMFGSELSRLVALLALPQRAVRRRPELVWMAGAAVAAYVVGLVLDHMSLSQIYFARTVIPVGIAFAVAVVALTRPRPVHVVLAAFAGIGGAIALHAVEREPAQTYDVMAKLVAGTLLVTMVAAAAEVVVRRLRRNGAPLPERSPRSVTGAVALGVTFALALSMTSRALFLAPGTPRPMGSLPVSTAPAVDPKAQSYVSPAELSAARWLADHSDPRDVVVTNAFCTPVPWQQGKPCRAAQFWVPAVTGRRTFLSGWAFTPISAAELATGRSQFHRPSPYPERLALSLAAVERPTRASWLELRDRHGVRWIFADRRAGTVAPALEASPAVVHRTADVVVVDLALL